MTTNGVQAVYLETHNWGKAARFFRSLGFALEFETDHNSGQLRDGDSPYLFTAEISADKTPQMQQRVRRCDWRCGGPFISFYTPDEILAVASEAGFQTVRHASGTWLGERYFADRPDGLKPSSGGDLLIAAA